MTAICLVATIMVCSRKRMVTLTQLHPSLSSRLGGARAAGRRVARRLGAAPYPSASRAARTTSTTAMTMSRICHTRGRAR